jgi:hypothetical protein
VGQVVSMAAPGGSSSSAHAPHLQQCTDAAFTL